MSVQVESQRLPLVPTEASVLRQFGLRWAVLAAWREDLHRRGVALVAGLDRRLAGSRVKIASGCFSSCEVGCDLAAVERDLATADASSPAGTMGFWIDLLGRAMSGAVETEELLRIPSVRAQYVNCGARPCRCDN